MIAPVRALWIAAGVVAVGLGVLGAVLPLLPATPFLLLAAFCFARSSDRLHRWLLGHRWLGPYIRNFRDRRGFTRGQKTAILGLLWASIGATVWFALEAWWGRATLLAIAVCVTTYVVRLPDPDRAEPPAAAGPPTA